MHPVNKNSSSLIHQYVSLNIRCLYSVLSLTIVLIITSSLNYFKFREIFWAVELPQYLLCSIVCFFTAFAINFHKGVVQLNAIDIVIFIFFIYSISSAYLLASPFLPSDRIYGLLGFIAFYSWMRMSGYFSSEGTFLLYGILSGVLLQACWGLLQYLTLSPVYIGRSGIQGGFINPGIYGCFMAVGLIIIIHLITIYKGTKPGLIFLITTTMLVLAALIFSLSRTAYIAALLGTGILLSPRLDFKCHVWFMRFRFLLLGAFIIAFIGLFYYLWQRNTLSVSGRFLIWKISFRMFMDYPVFGIGYGNFFTEYGNYQAAYFQSGNGTLQEVKTAGLNYYPFNELLKVAVENGIIGLALFLWMLILCIRSWSRIKAKYPHLIVFISMLIVIMIFGMFSYPLQSDAINCVFYFSIAAIASFQMSLYTFNFNRIKKISMLIPVILLFGLSMRKINALNDWRKAQSSMVYAEGDALRKYEKIYHVLDNNGAFLFNYGALLADMNVNDKSLNILTSAQRYLSNPKLATILAIIYNRMQNYGKAERYYLSCAYMEPKRFVPFNTLLVFYRNTGQTFKAQNIARKIIDKPVKIPSLRISEIKNAARQYLFVSQNDKPPLLNKK